MFDQDGVVIDQNDGLVDQNGFVVDQQVVLIDQKAVLVDQNQIEWTGGIGVAKMAFSLVFLAWSHLWEYAHETASLQKAEMVANAAGHNIVREDAVLSCV